MTPREFLSDKVLQEQFDDLGYIVLDEFLPLPLVNDLRQFYLENPNELSEGFHATPISNNENYRKEVHQYISQRVLPFISNLMTGYKIALSTYVIKEKGTQSFFDFHLDWTMVDERKFRSITVWIPLEDVDNDNGNLCVLEGSHRMCYTIRGGPAMFMLSELPVSEILKNKYKVVKIPLRAGGAVLYDHRLFHGSPANVKSNCRVAINVALIPEESEAVHCFLNNSNVDVYDATGDFYTTHLHSQKPTSSIVCSITKSDFYVLKDEHIRQIQSETL